MIKWTFCKTDVPEYEDLIILCNSINYAKRRILSLTFDPAENGYDDVFSAQEAANNYIETLDQLSNEYRYMVKMHWPTGRTA